MASVRELIDAAPIRKLQLRVLLLCILVNMAEGYDILSMAIAVVPLSQEWGLSGSQVGLLLALGPIGMAIGSFTLGPASDRLGRRTVLLVSLTITAVALLLSAMAHDLSWLMAFRLMVGIGTGGVLPCVSVLVGEYAPTRKRSAMIGFMSAGVPLGAAIGGGVAATLMDAHGWRAVFYFGAAITALMAVSTLFGIPEAPDYLESKNTERARAALARLVDKLDLTGAIPVVATSDEEPLVRNSVQPVRRSRLMSTTTVILCVCFVLANATYYFGNQWLPKLLVIAGMSTNQGVSGVLMLSLGGAAGAAMLGLFTIRFSSFSVTAAASLASAVLLVLFALVASDLTPSLIVAVLLGACLAATPTGLYTLVPILYSPEHRATAMGLCLGVGRVGSIVTPLLVGFLVDRGQSPESIFLLIAVPAVLGALLVITLQRSRRVPTATAAESTTVGV